MSDPTKTEEAINDYFKLKAAYYKKYNASIKNIRENEKKAETIFDDLYFRRELMKTYS